MSIWIKSPLAIHAQDAGGGIVVKHGVIVELVKKAAQPKKQFDSFFDASEHVILPGLINTHHHFFQTLTRSYELSLDKKLFDWLKILYPVWAKLTPDMLSVATELALVELMLSGCTTTTDHHYVFPRGLEAGLDIQVEVARKLGMRVVLTRGSMDLSEHKGGFPPEEIIQGRDVILEDSLRLIETYHERGPGSLIQIALAPCSPFSVTKQLMTETANLASKCDVLLHTHLAETEEENKFCLEHMGMRPLDYLEECGWLEERTWLAHGIFFNDDELKRLAKNKVGIATCPHSNMILGSGIFPLCGFEKQKGIVGIGVDGSASNDASNMIEEVRQAMLLQRMKYGPREVSHLDALRWASEGSAGCIKRNDLGKIEVGRRADIALFKLDELRYSGHEDPLASLVRSGSHRADHVMIEGKWKVKSGTMVDLDLQDLINRHALESQKIRALSD